jgi:aerobic carbon-monoxide dehydrogenase medium subunit
MIPPQFDYEAPTTIDDAVNLLSGNPNAKILAGGQSLIPMMRFRLAEPALLVDINRIEDLSYIHEENGWLRVGAMTREADLENSSLVASRYPLLYDTSRVIADPLVRNRSTLGGNLAHADPANDHPATMLAYGAQVVARGPQGERTIPIDEFFTGYFSTSLNPGEIITEIQMPSPQGRSGGAYKKLERKVGDFGTVAVAVQLMLDDAGTISGIGIGLTNVGEVPIRAIQAEQALLGNTPDDAVIQQAATLAAAAAQPSADHRGSEAYKRSLVATLTSRAIHKALERAQGGGR